MTNIKAAAERLRRQRNGSLSAYGFDIERRHADESTLADYALTLLDETPIADCYATDPANWRDEWLVSIGFRPDDEQDYLFINAGCDAMFDLQAMAAGPWRLATPEDSVDIPRPRTRGAVRLLLAALGVGKARGEQ